MPASRQWKSPVKISKLLSLCSLIAQSFDLIISFVILLAVTTHESHGMLYKSIPFTSFQQARRGPRPLVIGRAWWASRRRGIFFRTAKQLIYTLIVGKSPIFTLELSQKSNFQPSTTKPDNIGHPTVKTGQIWPLGWFWRWFCIF